MWWLAHDDVIKWRYFPRNWPFVQGMHRSFPSQRPVTRIFDVFFDLCLNKRLSKQSWGWWFQTPSRSLWRHRNGVLIPRGRQIPSITQSIFGCCWSLDVAWILYQHDTSSILSIFINAICIDKGIGCRTKLLTKAPWFRVHVSSVDSEMTFIGVFDIFVIWAMSPMWRSLRLQQKNPPKLSVKQVQIEKKGRENSHKEIFWGNTVLFLCCWFIWTGEGDEIYKV